MFKNINFSLKFVNLNSQPCNDKEEEIFRHFFEVWTLPIYTQYGL